MGVEKPPGADPAPSSHLEREYIWKLFCGNFYHIISNNAGTPPREASQHQTAPKESGFANPRIMTGTYIAGRPKLLKQSPHSTSMLRIKKGFLLGSLETYCRARARKDTVLPTSVQKCCPTRSGTTIWYDYRKTVLPFALPKRQLRGLPLGNKEKLIEKWSCNLAAKKPQREKPTKWDSINDDVFRPVLLCKY